MIKSLKSILFVICVVMVFTAQTNRPDDKGEQHAAASRPASGSRSAPVARTAPVSYNNPRASVQTRREAPVQTVQRTTPLQRGRILQPRSQPAYQETQPPRVYAVPTPAPVVNNRFLNRQQHNRWQPRYNFYDNQYHFYPYVNIATLVELSGGYLVTGPDGQSYYYDQGTFYIPGQNGQYEAVAPPVGIIVNPIVANARQIEVDGQIFFRYKGVFYVQVAQGYQVISPVQPVPADQ